MASSRLTSRPASHDMEASYTPAIYMKPSYPASSEAFHG